jgi:hypothetical protein
MSARLVALSSQRRLANPSRIAANHLYGALQQKSDENPGAGISPEENAWLTRTYRTIVAQHGLFAGSAEFTAGADHPR